MLQRGKQPSQKKRAASAARAASEAVAAVLTAASTSAVPPPVNEPTSQAQEVDMDISDGEDLGHATPSGASTASGTGAPLDQGGGGERRQDERNGQGQRAAVPSKQAGLTDRVWTFEEDEQLIRLRSAGIASQDVATFVRVDSKLVTARLQKTRKQQKEHDAQVAKGDPPWYMHGRPLPRLLPMSGAHAVEPAAAKDKFGVPLVASSIGPLAWTDEDDAALRAARAAALAAGQRSWKAIPWSFGRTRWPMKLRWELKEREWAAAGLIPALDTPAPADTTASASAVPATPAVPAAGATGAVPRRNNVDLSNPPPRHVPSRSGSWTAENDRQLLQLKLQLLSSKEIAREVRRSRTAVATRCRELQDGWLAANLLPKKLMLPPIPPANVPQPPNLPHASASTTPAPPSALPPPAPPTPPICTIDALVREYDGPLMRFVDYSSPSPPPAKRPRLAVSSPTHTQPEQLPAALAAQNSAHAPTSAASASASPTSPSAWTPASHAKLLELRRDGVSRGRCALILGMPEKLVKVRLWALERVERAARGARGEEVEEGEVVDVTSVKATTSGMALDDATMVEAEPRAPGDNASSPHSSASPVAAAAAPLPDPPADLRAAPSAAFQPAEPVPAPTISLETAAVGDDVGAQLSPSPSLVAPSASLPDSPAHHDPLDKPSVPPPLASGPALVPSSEPLPTTISPPPPPQVSLAPSPATATAPYPTRTRPRTRAAKLARIRAADPGLYAELEKALAACRRFRSL